MFLRNCLRKPEKEDCPDKNLVKEDCHIPLAIEIVRYILVFFNFMLLGKEIFQMLHDFVGYIRRWENWLQLLIILSVFLCAVRLIHQKYMYSKTQYKKLNNLQIPNQLPDNEPIPIYSSERNKHMYTDHWQHHIAAISIFLSWLELMLIVGRFPMFGLYIQMFSTGAHIT